MQEIQKGRRRPYNEKRENCRANFEKVRHLIERWQSKNVANSFVDEFASNK